MSQKLSLKFIRYASNARKSLSYIIRKPDLSENRFVILGRGRTGSTALVNLLNNVDGVQCDDEILRYKLPFPKHHILSKCTESSEKTYGFKLITYQIQQVQNIRDHLNFIQDLYNSGFKVVYTKRDNMLKQIISHIRANIDGYHYKKNENYKAKKLLVNPEKVAELLEGSNKFDKYEMELLSGLSYLPLSYENHLENEEVHQSTVDLVCNFLGIKSSQVITEYKKMSPKSLSDSVENYAELQDFFRNTKYSEFFD
ncbi:MAG: hypothetical protein DHS20C13_11820 [Thermodesulfobacteriota bacterium]|nr:MAG: hypothetical protein DHS20C13_11820 [Thermodesulfobacteriota bacterium]